MQIVWLLSWLLAGYLGAMIMRREDKMFDSNGWALAHVLLGWFGLSLAIIFWLIGREWDGHWFSKETKWIL